MMTRIFIFAFVLQLASAAHAGDFPGGPEGPRMSHPPDSPGVPSPEMLATVPGLAPAQQSEVRKILIERRDAHEKLRAKDDADRLDAMAKSRSEHERIDDESSRRLRKLLGDEGYRALAGWLVPPRGLFMEPRRSLPDAKTSEPPRFGDASHFDERSPVR